MTRLASGATQMPLTSSPLTQSLLGADPETRIFEASEGGRLNLPRKISIYHNLSHLSLNIALSLPPRDLEAPEIAAWLDLKHESAASHSEA